MIVTLDYMDVLFEECNREYFACDLADRQLRHDEGADA